MNGKQSQKLKTFLNILLVIGAIVSIATIDGGKWIANYVTFIASAQVMDDRPQAGDTEGGTPEMSANQPAKQAQDACMVVSQLAAPDWYNTYGIIRDYNQANRGRNQPSAGAEAPVICSK